MADEFREEKIIRGKKVMEMTGLPKSTVYDKIKSGDFPKPIQLSERSVGWLESEIRGWIKERIEQSRPSEKKAAG